MHRRASNLFSGGRRAAGFFLPIFFLSSALTVPAAAHIAPEQVVIVANRSVPESISLARYYASVRGIPLANICLLDGLPDRETITREEYEQRLRDPLLKFLRRRGLVTQERRRARIASHQSAWRTRSSSILCLVSIYGVPLHIAESRPKLLERMKNVGGRARHRDEAAVDSELTMLLMPPYDIRGGQACPVYGKFGLPRETSDGGFFLVAARLDGPSPQVVRRMIADAIWAETNGLHGRCYFDARSVDDPQYMAGDAWIESAYERFRREGYECVLDRTPGVWGEAVPMDDAAVYFGWYAPQVVGPFLRKDFRFRRGALAFHIHSTSAESLRSATRYWAGPLLARGAAATIGAVAEPYLSLTAHFDILADRLCRGYPFGEAAYMSLPVVSWQMTVVGDPLYRPFAVSLDEQIRRLERAEAPEVEWAWLRKMNRMVLEGRFNVALDYCRERLRRKNSLVLRERLGDLYLLNNLFKEARAQYENVLENTASPDTAMRVGLRWMLALEAMGHPQEAVRLKRRLRRRWHGSPLLSWLEIAE